MRTTKYWGIAMAGAGAGAVNGLFGAGGGMVLIPLLTLFTQLEDAEIFPSSISIILPICLVSLTVTAVTGQIPWAQSIPYLVASAVGGVFAGLWGRKIPLTWLHKGLGVLILWGGGRYLC